MRYVKMFVVVCIIIMLGMLSGGESQETTGEPAVVTEAQRTPNSTR